MLPSTHCTGNADMKVLQEELSCLLPDPEASLVQEELCAWRELGRKLKVKHNLRKVGLFTPSLKWVE